MKLKIHKAASAGLLAFTLFTGCVKNKTRFFDDPQASGLGIFSNTGNNVFSCYLNNAAWRTEARETGGIILQNNFEVYVRKQYFDSLRDILIIDWYGSYFGEPNSSPDQISLNIYVPKTFGISDFAAWQGKRLTIDSSTGYFVSQTNPNFINGYGIIYFNMATFDPTIVNGVAGRMSGLVEADFGTIKLTSGRFDHNLEPAQFFVQ